MPLSTADLTESAGIRSRAYRCLMEIAVLLFLVAAGIGLALVSRGRSRRSWDETDAWDAVKRVGGEASKGKERSRRRRA